MAQLTKGPYMTPSVVLVVGTEEKLTAGRRPNLLGATGSKVLRNSLGGIGPTNIPMVSCEYWIRFCCAWLRVSENLFLPSRTTQRGVPSLDESMRGGTDYEDETHTWEFSKASFIVK